MDVKELIKGCKLLLVLLPILYLLNTGIIFIDKEVEKEEKELTIEDKNQKSKCETKNSQN